MVFVYQGVILEVCGIIGIASTESVNQLLYDGLLVLQHRGQDSAGIVTAESNTFHMAKGPGLVRDVFRTRDMRNLEGEFGIGHCRYPTAGSASSSAEVQPLYVNSPFGIVLAHNGNLTNSDQLASDIFREDFRHVNTNSDSEVLLNVLAHELQKVVTGHELEPSMVFSAVKSLHQRVKGAYAVVAMIAGYGLLAFRDPCGIRPLIIGVSNKGPNPEYLISSESVAANSLGFDVLRDVKPGETIFIDMNKKLYSDATGVSFEPSPCIFEYVYLARPDSVMNGISVYETRLRMGRSLAEKIKKEHSDLKVDVVIPIPDSSRPAAMEMAVNLNIPFREGFIKNRYIGRTFIMPGQEKRKKSVRQKLNPISMEFKGKNVMLVDDSIVRGTTAREIVQMAREAGAAKVFFASAAPPVRFPNVYGIDMPSVKELIANGRTNTEISKELGVDRLIYQSLESLVQGVKSVNPEINQFETSCFTGDYVTGDITQEYLSIIESRRSDNELSKVGAQSNQLDLNLV